VKKFKATVIFNMKKLNIFASKRSSREIPSPTTASTPSAPTDTLHRIVNAKEEAQRRWIEEQEEFRRKQREHEIQMIEMEGAEVKRREIEVKKLGTELEETRRKNRQIQDKVAEQIEILQRKLEEYKVEHKIHEESIEDDITTKEEAIFQVKESLEKRRKTLECDEELDDVSDTCLQDKTGSVSPTNMYPTIPLSEQNHAKPTATNVFWYTSKLPKSPQLSANSAANSRSATPKTDTSDENSSL